MPWPQASARFRRGHRSCRTSWRFHPLERRQRPLAKRPLTTARARSARTSTRHFGTGKGKSRNGPVVAFGVSTKEIVAAGQLKAGAVARHLGKGLKRDTGHGWARALVEGRAIVSREAVLGLRSETLFVTDAAWSGHLR